MNDIDALVTDLLAEFGDSWKTPEEIASVRERLIARIPGWTLPASYGLAREADGRIEFARANFGEHPLPAIVLSTVLGHEGGSASYPMDAALLAQAIRLLEPAEVCTAYDHPNLWTWRVVLQDIADGGEAVAVFTYDPESEDEDAAVKALRALEPR
jgi:hypothetical protein